jgi:hypothetical protein
MEPFSEQSPRGSLATREPADMPILQHGDPAALTHDQPRLQQVHPEFQIALEVVKDGLSMLLERDHFHGHVLRGIGMACDEGILPRGRERTAQLWVKAALRLMEPSKEGGTFFRLARD